MCGCSDVEYILQLDSCFDPNGPFGIIPFIANLIISVDTFRSEIAKRSFEEGANIINDISGGSYDDKMHAVTSEGQVVFQIETESNVRSESSFIVIDQEVYAFFGSDDEFVYAVPTAYDAPEPQLGGESRTTYWEVRVEPRIGSRL